MKISKEKAAENRETILNQGGRLFRERGISAVGVDAVAAASNLTHGSLYSQFGSKDNVLIEVMLQGFDQIATVGGGSGTAEEAIRGYLSSRHRDDPGSGCFMAALAGEMRRQSEPVRTRFTEMLKSNVKRLAANLGAGRKGRQREDQTLTAMATMVGAIILSRAVNDPQLSGRILSASKSQLLTQTTAAE